MKKNLMSVLILALVLVNTILTAIMAIAIVPQTKKSNELVNSVASAIKLEMNGDSSAKATSVPMDQITTYDLENEMTINFKPGDDGKEHYVVLKASISMDNKSDGYKDYGAGIAEKSSIITNEINNVVSSYTYEEFRSDQQAVQDEILKNLQVLFDSDFIVSVGFSSVTSQ
ncbi:MAG: flagellar basal body-associated protein FliL [Lachnospiraceae bacterium]|nr:flagellar basal body-associated protein FliL [Lachnospiraceae bacterium]